MRTTVHTSTTDPDETDEWPACGATVGEEGELTIVTDSMLVEGTYTSAEWASVEIVNQESKGNFG